MLVERWAGRALEEQPDAPRVSQEDLLDHLLSFLTELGRGLAEPVHSENGPHTRSAIQHGAQRWHVGWSLGELVRDYQILRLVVLEFLDETLDRPLQVREVLAVGLAFDEAIGASVKQYVGHRDDEFKKLERSLSDQATALKEGDRRKNEFLATLAHELRNPLAPLRNALEILRLTGPDAAPPREIRDIMDRQVQQMTRLVDDLLDVSRIAQGKLVLRKERLDLRGIVEQAVQMNAPLVEARKHKLEVRLPKAPLWVDADRSRCLQVIVNLLNNAAKYTAEGGLLSLLVEAVDSEAVVQVRDNGIGIAPEMLTHIFDLFTQIDFGSERADGGLGIGLTLVRRLVELHGGSIAAESDGIGRGSTFRFALPASADDGSAAATTSESTKANGARRILIVEDNADGRESLALLLRLLGHHVVVAEDGPRGIQAALADKPQIALIDIGLPGCDGYEVARQVRAALQKGTVLVALTGHSQPEDRRRALEAGFDTHLTKPVELEALQQLLGQLPSA